MTENITENTEETTEEIITPVLDPEKVAEWQRVKGLITDAQTALISFFDKLEQQLGGSITIESVELDRTSRSPLSKYSWEDPNWTEFTIKNPEAKAVFHQRIDNVMIVVKFDKEEV